MSKETRKRNKDEKYKKLRKKRWLLFLLIVIWAVIVYSFSNQTGEESSGLSYKVSLILFGGNEDLASKAEPIVRKLAHFSEYAIGGLLMYLEVNTYDFKKKNKLIIASGLGIWYAALDEVHQLFVFARHGSILDVLIDSLGVITGVIITSILIRKRKKGENIATRQSNNIN